MDAELTGTFTVAGKGRQGFFLSCSLGCGRAQEARVEARRDATDAIKASG
jgi:hypothetical protein